MEFVRAGGPLPAFWIEPRANAVARRIRRFAYADSWPVYATNAQAAAYAAWKGCR